MQDQSAEATLQYILDCGINAIELMGNVAENYLRNHNMKLIEELLIDL